MYGDTGVMRRRADQLREQGVDIRALADQLVTQTEAIGWSGRAADSMRERITERSTHLRAAAAQHETAADALERHEQEVSGHQETIASIERKAGALIADATTRIAQVRAANDSDADSGVHRLPDADDQTLADFVPPPSGHKDWMHVSLPGL